MPKLTRNEEKVRAEILAPILAHLLKQKLQASEEKYILPNKTYTKIAKTYEKCCPWITVG